MGPYFGPWHSFALFRLVFKHGPICVYGIALGSKGSRLVAHSTMVWTLGSCPKRG